jgi:hypothetical protein
MLMHRILHKARENKFRGCSPKGKAMCRKQMYIIFSVMHLTLYVIVTVINARLKLKSCVNYAKMPILKQCNLCRKENCVKIRNIEGGMGIIINLEIL